MNPIRVIIADDSPLFREGVKSHLDTTDGFQVIGQASNGRSLLSVINEDETDIVLMDIKMPEKDGIECTNCLLYTSPSPRDATLSRMPSSA